MNIHDDFNTIISVENLLDAWREFKRGKTKKSDVMAFDFHLEHHILQLHHQLKNKTYTPEPYTAFFVCDPKLRHVHKASVRDRVVHQAIYRQLYHVFDPQFIHDSYSCRVGKGTHAGVQRLEYFSRKASGNFRRPIWYLKCDVSRFFDSIDHVILKQKLASNIINQDTLLLCNTIIDSFSKLPEKGLPLGNVTSQLFANVYLHTFDHFMKHDMKIKYYLRYCDDFVILHHDRTYLEKLLSQAQHFLTKHLGLTIHPRKITLKKFTQGIDFLGYVTFPHYRIIRTRTRQRMIRKLKKHSDEAILQSYLGIAKHAHAYRVKKILVDLLRNN